MDNNFTDQERIAFYNAIEYLDPNKQYILYDKDQDTLSYTKLILSREDIKGRPSDEELTRALILIQMIKKYGYNSDRIEIENSFKIGGRNTNNVRAVETDICIKDENNEIIILCEIKRIHEFDGTGDLAIQKQLFDPYEGVVKYNKSRYLYYLSVDCPLDKEHFPIKCIGIDTNIAGSYNDWKLKGKVPHYLDIIPSGEKPIIQNVYVKLSENQSKDNIVIKDLDDNYGIDNIKRIWRQLWDHIWGGTLEDNKKFENFNKILLAKIYDERKTKEGVSYSVLVPKSQVKIKQKFSA